MPKDIEITEHEAAATTVIRYAPGGPAAALVVLAHGAGAGQRHPFMTAMARGLSERGIAVATFDFPYMRQRQSVPDKAPVLEQSFRDVIAAAMPWFPGVRVFVGGKSMGGRMATHLAAQEPTGFAGVVALGYPLHPPGKPQQLRSAHLPAITAPVLVVQGERDAFGTPAELGPVLATMRAPVTLHVVAGADHSLQVRGKRQQEVFEATVAAVAAWMGA